MDTNNSTVKAWVEEGNARQKEGIYNTLKNKDKNINKTKIKKNN